MKIEFKKANGILFTGHYLRAATKYWRLMLTFDLQPKDIWFHIYERRPGYINIEWLWFDLLVSWGK